MTISDVMKSRWSLAGLVAVVVALPNLGKGLEAVSYLIRTPEVAYAAQEKADETERDFDRFIASFEAQQQIQQQYYEQQLSPQTFIEYDPRGVCWRCRADTYETCWNEQRWEECT